MAGSRTTASDHPLAVAHDEIVWEFVDPGQLNPGDRGMFLASALLRADHTLEIRDDC